MLKYGKADAIQTSALLPSASKLAVTKTTLPAKAEQATPATESLLAWALSSVNLKPRYKKARFMRAFYFLVCIFFTSTFIREIPSPGAFLQR